jgi:hypothetical protein
MCSHGRLEGAVNFGSARLALLAMLLLLLLLVLVLYCCCIVLGRLASVKQSRRIKKKTCQNWLPFGLGEEYLLTSACCPSTKWRTIV